MTKEEVREVSICKLHLTDGAVVYDIGSGTGSVAVEIAGLSETVHVYAIERKPEAGGTASEEPRAFPYGQYGDHRSTGTGGTGRTACADPMLLSAAVEAD